MSIWLLRCANRHAESIDFRKTHRRPNNKKGPGQNGLIRLTKARRASSLEYAWLCAVNAKCP
jgi:hypothetical protein